jgi:hypothetical protein
LAIIIELHAPTGASRPEIFVPPILIFSKMAFEKVQTLSAIISGKKKDKQLFR